MVTDLAVSPRHGLREVRLTEFDALARLGSWDGYSHSVPPVHLAKVGHAERSEPITEAERDQPEDGIAQVFDGVHVQVLPLIELVQEANG